MSVTLSTIGNRIYDLLGLNDTSSPQPNAPASTAPAAESSGIASGFLYSAYHVLFGTGSLSGCLSEGDQVLDQNDGGMGQDPPHPDADQLDGGAWLNPDGTVTLPEDGTMSGDVFFLVDGSGTHLQVCNLAPYGSNFVQGSGLQNSTVAILIGTDSTAITANEFYPNAPTMPAGGCFPGLINVNPANELASCNEYTGYGDFAVCPQNENNRLNGLFHGDIVLRNYEYYGTSCPGSWDPDGEDVSYRFEDGSCFELDAEETITFSTLEQLYADLDSGTPVGTLCGAAPLPYSLIVPGSWHSDGNLYMTASPDLIMDARAYDESNPFFSIFRMSWSIVEE